MKSKKRKIWG